MPTEPPGWLIDVHGAPSEADVTPLADVADRHELAEQDHGGQP